jgi:ketosteroid isomerase-like protein
MQRQHAPFPAAVLLFLLALAPVAAHAQAAPNPERAAVQQVITRFGEHIRAGELDAIAALFPPRGVHILTDDATTHGWAEYRDEHLRPEMAYHGGHYVHSAVEAVVREDVAWVAFRREFGPPDTPARVSGRGTAVLEKRDDGWVIVHLHMSR